MSDRQYVVGIDGRPIEVGDRVAFTATGWNKKHAMSLGTVKRITATRTVITVEKSSGHRSGDTETSAIDDSLGRILLLDVPVSEKGVEAALRNVIAHVDYDTSKEIDRAGTEDAEDDDAETWDDLTTRFFTAYNEAVYA